MSQTTDPLSGAVIQPREIYDAIVRLTGRVDVLIIQTEEVRSDVKDHEQRIRALESSRWPLPTLAALVSLAAFVIALLNLLK